MPAHKVVSGAQMEHLLQFMELNRDLAVGRMSSTTGPHGKQAVRQKWEALAAELNTFGTGATKPAMKWRDYWCEKKYAVRKKAQQNSINARGTGGGPSKEMPLSPMEERILALLSNVAVEGNSEVRIPFEFQNRSENSSQPLFLEISTTPPSPLPPPPQEPAPPASPVAGPSSAPPVFFTSTPNSSVQLLTPSVSSVPPVTERSRHSRAATNARIDPPAPRWALEFEERNTASQERQAAALEQLTVAATGITSAVLAMTQELAAIRQCLNKLYEE